MERKSLLWLGLITYSVLIIFAILFYKERMVFNDAAYHLFAILDKNDFAFQNHRYVAAFTQAFPLFASRLGLPLEYIAILYSVSFEFFAIIVFLVLISGFKNTQLALGFLLFSTLMVRHSFFWCLSELVQGTSVYFIYLAFWFRSIEKGYYKAGVTSKLLMFSLLILLVFSHPLMPFCVLFGSMFLFLFFRNEDFSVRKSIIVHSIFYTVLYLLRSYFLRTGNDTSSSSSFIRGLKLFPNYFDIPSNINFVRYFLYDYTFISLIAIAVGLYYLIKREYLFLLLFSTAFFVYTFINNISEPYGFEQFYVEYRYLILSVFVIFPFVFHLLPLIKSHYTINIIVSIPVMLSLFFIFNLQPTYLKRTRWHQNLMKRTADFPKKKLIVVPNEGIRDSLRMYWGAPYEMWLISTIETGESRSIIIEESPNQFDEAMSQNAQFQTKWAMCWYSYFHSKYIQFNDTTTAYVKYEY